MDAAAIGRHFVDDFDVTKISSAVREWNLVF